MSRSNTKKSAKSAKSPVPPNEAEQDENAYSKILENANKRNELLKMRKEAKKAKKGNGVPAGATPPLQPNAEFRSKKSEYSFSTSSSMGGFPEMLRGFFEEKDVVGMSTEMKADGTLTHTFHFKKTPSSSSSSKVTELDGDSDDSDTSDTDSTPTSETSSETSSGAPRRKMPRFTTTTRNGRTIKVSSGGHDDLSLSEFLSNLSSVLHDQNMTTGNAPRFKFTCSDSKEKEEKSKPESPKKPAPTPSQTPAQAPPAPKPSTPAPASPPKAQPKVARDPPPGIPQGVLTGLNRGFLLPPSTPKAELKTRSIQTDEMHCTDTCSKCARTSEHCKKAQQEADEAQRQAKKFEEKASRTDVAEKKCKELQKEVKKNGEEREKREKEVKKMEKNHANELRKKDREMEAFRDSTQETAEKLAEAHAEALKKSQSKTMSLEKQIESLKDDLKQVQTCMDSFEDVENWLKTEKLKTLELEDRNLQLEAEIGELKRQERKSSPGVWGNPDAKKDAEEIKKLKAEIMRHLENDAAQAQINAETASKVLDAELRCKDQIDLRLKVEEDNRKKDKQIIDLTLKTSQLLQEVEKLKMDFRIRESENKVIGKEKNRIDELKLENNTLSIRLRQSESTVQTLIQQLAKGNVTDPLTNGFAHLSMRSDVLPPPSRSTWSTLSTSSDSPPAFMSATSFPQRQQDQRNIPNIPEWMRNTVVPSPIGTKPATPSSTQDASEPTPEWLTAVVKNSDPDGDWVGAVLPDDDDIDVSVPPPPVVGSLVQSFGGFRPLIPDRMEENKCFVCLWEIKPQQTTLECSACRRKVHELCGLKLQETGEPCWGCEQQKKGFHNTKK